jgi:hypothetical protein
MVVKVSVQNTAEIPPKTISALIWSPNMAFITYNGEFNITKNYS